MSGNNDQVGSGGRQEYAPVAMAETLIDSDAPVATGVAHVEVVAPATLPEGYKFEAQVGSMSVTVTVPQGGVEEGQKFSAPIQSGGQTEESPNLRAMAVPRVSVPVGHWKDHWCDVCNLGCCHQLVGLSYCCTPLAMAQVMTRLKLNWLGDEDVSTKSTFRVVLGTFLVYVVLNPFFAFYYFPGTIYNVAFNVIRYIVFIFAIEQEELENASTKLLSTGLVYLWINLIYNAAFLVYMVYALTKTRRRLREKYAIPEVYCRSGVEDFCCSCFCSCCTVSQMARHTADYETYAASCCSETGLPSHVPSIV